MPATGNEAYEEGSAKSGKAGTIGLILNPAKPGGAEEGIWRAWGVWLGGGGGGRQHQEPQALPVATPLNTSNAVLDVGEKSGARKTRHVCFSAGIASELDFFCHNYVDIVSGHAVQPLLSFYFTAFSW